MPNFGKFRRNLISRTPNFENFRGNLISQILAKTAKSAKFSSFKVVKKGICAPHQVAMLIRSLLSEKYYSYIVHNH